MQGDNGFVRSMIDLFGSIIEPYGGLRDRCCSLTLLKPSPPDDLREPPIDRVRGMAHSVNSTPSPVDEAMFVRIAWGRYGAGEPASTASAQSP